MRKYSGTSKWFRERDERLVELASEIGLQQAAERMGLSKAYAGMIVRFRTEKPFFIDKPKGLFMAEKKTIYVVGYQPRESILPEDYRDFKVGTSFDFDHAKRMLNLGVFPPGIILMMRDGFPGVIKGEYGQRQSVEPISVPEVKK